MPEPNEISDELMGDTKTAPTKPQVPTKPEQPQIKPSKIEQPVETPQRKAGVQYEEEEQDINSIDFKLNDLAEQLGTEKVDNTIKYNGMTIEFYSEPMCFAIDGKTKFKIGGRQVQLTEVEEVINYLNSVDTQEAGSKSLTHQEPDNKSLTQGDKSGHQRPIKEQKRYKRK